MRHLLAKLIVGLFAVATSFSQPSKLIGPDGFPNDEFGNAVAISGNTAVIGVPYDENFTVTPSLTNSGGAFIWVKNGSQWNVQQYLKGFSSSDGDVYGSSVAIDADVVVVGSPLDDITGAFVNNGSAFVHERSGTVWSQGIQLLPSDGTNVINDFFGQSVAVSGSTVVVGCPGKNVGSNQDQGAAYIYTRIDGAWVEQARLTAMDGASGDGFGSSVAISGDKIIVGAVSDDAPNDAQGSAYIFSRSGAVWTETTKLTASDGHAGDLFGGSVAISGNAVVVGSHQSDLPNVNLAGAAYVFEGNGAGWTQKNRLSGIADSDFFGNSVSISGSLAVIGSRGAGSLGEAHFYRRDLSGNWSRVTTFLPFETGGFPSFGSAVGISGGNVVVGAPTDVVNSQSNQGSAFVFSVPAFAVSVGGRVLRPDGRGVHNTAVSISDGLGPTRYAMTNPFGHYRFADVLTGATYTISVASKRFSYVTQTLTISNDLTNLDFTPQP